MVAKKKLQEQSLSTCGNLEVSLRARPTAAGWTPRGCGIRDEGEVWRRGSDIPLELSSGSTFPAHFHTRLSLEQVLLLK